MLPDPRERKFFVARINADAPSTPIEPLTGAETDETDPSIWLTYEDADTWANVWTIERPSPTTTYVVKAAVQEASERPPAQPQSSPAPVTRAPHVLTVNGRGYYEATLENLVYALSGTEKTVIGFDTFRGRIMIRQSVSTDWRPLSDTDMIQLREVLAREHRFAAVGKDLMHDALQLVAERHKFDSAVVWLDGLRWDGTPRVATFLSSYCGTVDDEYSRAVSHYIWTGLASRVYEPGCQLDMVVALQSPQGSHKSTGLQAMVPDAELFTDGLELHSDDDNFKRLLRGKLVVEIAEMAGLSRADITLVKRVITRRVEEWIEKWQTQPTRFPRRCMLFASTNEEQFLPKDDTGQRRWLPVEVTRIDRERIAAERDQLWAEAAEIFRSLRERGLPGVLYQDAERLAAGRHKHYEQHDIWESTIETWLSTPSPMPDGRLLAPPPCTRPLTVSEVLAGAVRLHPERMDVRAEKRAGALLRQLGYARRKVRVDGRLLWRWVRNTPL